MAGVTIMMIALALCSPSASAQDLEPRAYSSAPVGLNFLLAGYGYTDGGVAFDPAVPLTGAQIRTDSALFAYARSLGAWGRSAKFDVVLPVTSLSGSALHLGEPREREISGMADARLRFTINLFGAPAMTMREFASQKQDLNIGVSLQVTAPTGQYDPSRLVNIGTNRWSFRGEIGFSKVWGPWTVELVPGVAFYTDNTDLLNGSTVSQAPIYAVQAHAVYNFRSGIWAALDGTFFTGGRTTTNGVEGDTELRNTRLGLTIALPVNRRNSIKLYGSTGTSTRTGSDFNALGAVWQYRWGAGI